MENIKYVINPYVNIKRAGLKKYLIKQGIISSKSFVVETDGLSDEDICLLNKIVLEKTIDINKCSEELKTFLIEESILIEEHLSDTEKYYNLINSGEENKEIKGKRLGVICSDEAISLRIKENFRDTGLQICVLTLSELEKDSINFDFVLIIWEYYDSLTFNKINLILLKKNIPFMINFLDGNTTFISPIFINQETVCYNEMEIQLEAALFYKDSYLAYKNDKRNKKINFPYFMLGQILFFSTHLTLDYLITGRLKTKNRAFIFDLESLRYDIVDILPEPYCLACRNENKKVHDFL